MLFWRFLSPHAHLGPQLAATYSPFLVALSFFVAALAGYAALGVVDPGRVRQVLMNLAGNAIKFTPSGHVLIEVTALQLADTHALVRFGVEDTGIGIAPDPLSRVFERFTQADASTTRRYGGTGLGLSISKQLVELMGGSIGINSHLGGLDVLVRPAARHRPRVSGRDLPGRPDRRARPGRRRQRGEPPGAARTGHRLGDAPQRGAVGRGGARCARRSRPRG
ncbi:MAG TPA: ATP-binding protein [Thermoanaerobaculia bacterium]|nr:ATP-binding protein [Thermoanaerobaculia bacterium]